MSESASRPPDSRNRFPADIPEAQGVEARGRAPGQAPSGVGGAADEPTRTVGGSDEVVNAIYADPAVDMAMQRGKREELRRALQARRDLATSGAEQDVLDSMLRAPDLLMVRPIKRPPSLFTMRGIGSFIYGTRQLYLRANLHAATLFFTVLFIPIWPIARYLVRPAGSNAYRFFGRLPLTPAAIGMRAVVAAAVFSALGFGGWTLLQSQTSATVYVFNGYAVPLTVDLDGTVVTVEPDARQELHVGTGPAHIKTTRGDGVVVEELDVTFAGGGKRYVYNVLGGAAVYIEAVGYSTSPNPELGGFEMLAGPTGSFHEARGVDYWFEEPPDEVSLRGNSNVVYRHVLNVEEGGWLPTLSVNSEDVDAMCDILMAAIRVEGIETLAFDYYLGVAFDYDTLIRMRVPSRPLAPDGSAGKPRLVDDFARLVAWYPESLDVQRSAEFARDAAGHRPALIAEAKERIEREPDSAHAIYLYARLMYGDEAIAILEPALAKQPEAPVLRRGIAYELVVARRFDEALPHYEKLRELDPAQHAEVVLNHAIALAGLDRRDEAVRVLLAAMEVDSSLLTDSRVLVALANLTVSGDQAWRDKIPERSAESLVPRLDAELGKTPVYGEDDPEVRVACETMLELLKDRTASAAKRAVYRLPEARGRATDVVVILTAFRALQHGINTEDCARALDELLTLRLVAVSAIKHALRTGERQPELAGLPLDIQAAIALGLALQLDKDSPEAVELFEEVKRDDVLRSYVTRCMEAWMQ